MGTPDFDLAALEKIAHQLGEARFREIVGIFLDNTPERLQRVRSGLSSGALDDPAEALHSMKSSASILGANALERVADLMERAARENRIDEFRSRMPDLEQTIRATDEFLRGTIAGADS